MLPALYRHNLAQSCRALNPITGLFRHFRYQVRHLMEYKKIKKKELKNKKQVLFLFRQPCTFYVLKYEYHLSTICNFIEEGNDWISEIKNFSQASRIGNLFLTAIGILNVYKHCSPFIYKHLHVLASLQFNNYPWLHDEVYLMLQQFDYHFVNKVQQNIYCLSHTPNSLRAMNIYNVEKIKNSFLQN